MADRPTIVLHGFYQTFERDAEGNMTRPVDWVRYSPVHAPQSTVIEERVDKMRPPPAVKNDDEGKKMGFLRHRWSFIERAYEAWKQGIAVPEDGTALGAWPGLNELQATAFRNVGVRTVEGVRDLPENLISKVALPGVREIMKQAAMYLEARETNGVATRMAELEARNAALSERLEEAMSLLERQARDEAPRRGRKPAVEPAAEAA